MPDDRGEGNTLGPLDSEPVSVRPPFDERDPATLIPGRVEDALADRVAALREALAGVELGVYDVRMIEWLAGLDVSSVGTVVSWLSRVREADR